MPKRGASRNPAVQPDGSFKEPCSHCAHLVTGTTDSNDHRRRAHRRLTKEAYAARCKRSGASHDATRIKTRVRLLNRSRARTVGSAAEALERPQAEADQEEEGALVCAENFVEVQVLHLLLCVGQAGQRSQVSGCG